MRQSIGHHPKKSEVISSQSLAGLSNRKGASMSMSSLQGFDQNLRQPINAARQSSRQSRGVSGTGADGIELQTNRRRQPSNKQAPTLTLRHFQQVSKTNMTTSQRRKTTSSALVSQGGGGLSRNGIHNFSPEVVNKRTNASMVKLYQQNNIEEPSQLFERAYPSFQSHNPQYLQGSPNDLPNLFLSLNRLQDQPSSFNPNLLHSHHRDKTAFNGSHLEEVMPDGVNRPNSLEVQNRFSKISSPQKDGYSQSLYEQLKSGNTQSLRIRNSQTEINGPMAPSFALDKKINDILGKYLSPSRIHHSRQSEGSPVQQPSQDLQALKLISETLNTKLDTFQKQLKTIQQAPKLPQLITTDTQTELVRLQSMNEETLVEECESLKVERIRLQELVKQEKKEARRDQELMNEHLLHYQGQIEELKVELQKQKELFRVKSDAQDQEIGASVAKDHLIQQMTGKLQDQIRKHKDAKRQQDLLKLESDQKVAEAEERMRVNIDLKNREIEDMISEKQQEIDQLSKVTESQWRQRLKDAEQRVLEKERALCEQLKTQMTQEARVLQNEVEQQKRDKAENQAMFEQKLALVAQEHRRQAEEMHSTQQRVMKELSERQQILERKDSEVLKSRDRLSNMERDLMNVREQNKTFKQEMEDQQMTIDSLRKSETSTKGSMESQVGKLREQVTSEKQGKDHALEELRSLQNEFQKLKEFGKGKLQQLETEKSSLAEQSERLKEELDRVTEERENFERDLNEAMTNAQLSQSETQRVMSERIDEKNGIISDLESTVNQLRSDVNRLQPKIDKKRQSISLIKLQQEQVQTEIRSKESIIETLNSKYEHEISIRESKIQSQSTQLQDQEGLMIVEQTKIEELEVLIQEQREAMVQGNEERMAQIQSQFDHEKIELLEEIENLEIKQESLKTELSESLQNHLADSQVHQEFVHSLNEKHDRQVEDLQTTLDSTNADLKSKQNECTKYQNQLQQLNEHYAQEIQTRQQLMDDLKAKHGHLQNEYKQKEAQCNELTRTVQIYQSQSTDQESQHSQLTAQLQSQVQTLQGELNQQSQEAMETSLKLQQEIQKLNDQSSETQTLLTSQIQSISDELHLKEADLKQTQDQLKLQSQLATKLTEQIQAISTQTNSDQQTFKHQITKALEEKEALESELAKQKVDCSSMRNTQEQMNEKIEKKRAKIKSLKAQSNASQEEASVIRQQMTEVSGQLQTKIGEALKDSLFKKQQIESAQKSHESQRTTLESQVSDLSMVIQQIQVQKREKEEQMDDKLRKSQNECKEVKLQHESAVVEVQEKQSLIQRLRESADQAQNDTIDKLSKQVQTLTKEVKDREDSISQMAQQQQVRQQESMAQMSTQVSSLQQQHHDQTMGFQTKYQTLEQQFAMSQQKCVQLQELQVLVTTSLQERDKEMRKLKQDLDTRDKEIQDFFDTDYKQLQVKYDQSEQKAHVLEQTMLKLQTDLQFAQANANPEQALKPLIEEVKKKSQLLLVREAEIDSLKVMLKELKATMSQDQSSEEIQELKKQQSFTFKEKAMKDLMIDQLKKELEKNLGQLVNSKEKEAQMASVINALTVQNAMMGAATTNSNPNPSQSPAQQKKKPVGRPSLSLI